MSTEQSTLTDIGSASAQQTTNDETEGETDSEEARYRAMVSSDIRSPSTPDDAGCCKRCGESVERFVQSEHDRREVLRVFGDEHNRIGACPACVGEKDTGTISASVKAANATSEQTRQITTGERYRRDGWEP